MLTYDHIPPQCCGNKSLGLTNLAHNNQIKYAPNGLCFRTICADCNHRILGKLDQKFSNLLKEYRTYIESQLVLSEKIIINGNINDLQRCIIGHILAGFDVPVLSQYPHFQEQGDYRKILLKYFNGETDKLPDGIRIHYWVHEHDNIVYAPLFIYISNMIDKKSLIICSLIKFYPFSFMIVDYRETQYRFHLPELKSGNTNFFTLRYDKVVIKYNIYILTIIKQYYILSV